MDKILRHFMNRLGRHVVRIFPAVLRLDDRLRSAKVRQLIESQSWRQFVAETSFEFDQGRMANLDTNTRSMIYLAAPIQRSGHNFLANLIQVHPDVWLPKGTNLPGEHHLLDCSEHLIMYARQTSMLWKRWIEGGKEALDRHQANMIRFVGEGIIDYYYRFMPPGKRLLLKTSTTENLHNFQPLFPTSKLVILVRDGRDTIESYTKTWGDNKFEYASHTWARRVNAIYDYMEHMNSATCMAKHIRLVRYEDAYRDARGCMAGLLDFFELEQAKYDWEDVGSVPVVGSSIYKGRHEVNWHEKMQKSDKFKPIGKWKEWNKKRRSLFKKIAGRALIRAGYEDDLAW